MLQVVKPGSAGSLDSLAEILGPLTSIADDGKTPPKTAEDGRCDTTARPVALVGSQQTSQEQRSQLLR